MERSEQWRRCALAVAVIAGVGCGGKGGGGAVLDDAGGSSADAGRDAAVVVDAAEDARVDARVDAAVQSALTIEPSTLALDALAPLPVQFVARTASGAAATVSWSVEPKELGTIDAATGVFTPTGASGNLRITATTGSVTVTVVAAIAVNVTASGDPDYGTTPDGAGGIGGVGGEGGGSEVTDPTLRAALDGDATQDASLHWLYPYDGTVWPRGLPAPLLQWQHGEHAPVAVKLTISVDDGFHATLYLGPPRGVSTIDRIPIPQAVWRNAQLSGKTMKVALTFVANEGGLKTYKASQELTWTTAPTSLKGVVYYNSYGTKLAENYEGALGGNGRFGGATLSIEGGAFDPKLVAGSTTADTSGCRVCHTVSADGSTLIALRNDGMQGSVYDLRTGSERLLPSTDDGKFGWAALTPDGSAALGASGLPGLGNPNNTASLATSLMYSVADSSELAASGLSGVVEQAATPQFSPDGKKVAFNLAAGPGFGSVQANGKSLVVMDVARDANVFTYSNPSAIFTAASATQMPGWPFFLPDNSGVVFELELAPASDNEHLLTRHGAQGELWWTDLAGSAHALDAANGKGYLSTSSNGHGDDTVLQYEPTVAPIVAGGYAWVVFTSRRLYGNVATRDPYESDPRAYDLTPGNAGGPTTKKLWVTAISVPAKPGTDPSHPAFYLPAQELFAGNSRGFWSLDVCKADGEGCTGGDQCCNGYCEQSVEFPVCGTKPPNKCAAEYDTCTTSADCCKDGPLLTCIASHCATTIFL